MKKKIGNLVMVATITTFMTQGIYATSDLQAQQDSIEQQINETEESIANAESDRDKIVEELQLAELETARATEELESINNQLSQVEDELTQAEDDLAIATENRDSQYEFLKERISFMYEYGSFGYAEVLFESEDISDFFKRVEYVNAIIDHDKHLLDELEETQKEIDQKVQEISQKKSDIESLQAQQKAKTQELEAKEEDKQKALDAVNADIEAQQDVLFSLDEENEEIEQLIKDAQKNDSSDGGTNFTYDGGTLGWPAPDYTRMSSDYEQRINPVTGENKWHAGIDLATPYGSRVCAAEDGEVIYAGYMNGYGNTVIIDHGDGLSTLYGHNSSLKVSVGDEVARGDVIAAAGSTGNSTGNHCHFEVRINGEHTDPKPYLGIS